MFTEALLNTLLGMGTVFSMLILISILISFFAYIPKLQRRWNSFMMHRARRRKEDLDEAERKPPKRPILPKEIFEKTEEDEALIAVITAAIVAASDGAVSADQLIVRSVRRVKRR